MQKTYRAPSGNLCTMEFACMADGTDNMVLVTNWDGEPTEQDIEAFTIWFRGEYPGLNYKGARNMSGRSHEIRRRSEQFVKTGSFSLPEEN